MEKRVAIIGAGISGLLACKYILKIGYNPVVYEADDGIGGVWRHTIESTKLQNPKQAYQFSDFPWDSSVKEDCPSSQQVLDYLNSYAQHFSIVPYIRFNSKVIDIDYVGESDEEMKSWELWNGDGTPFGSKGKWHITVEDTKNFSTEVHKAEFVILCIGKYSGFPNIPEFPLGKGPENFKGKVMHSMDYSSLDNDVAADLIKNKSVTVIGSGKSALDIAAECANANGVTHPCTIIRRNAHWFLQDFNIWSISLGYFYFNRFAELLVHKPRENSILFLLATLLSPLRWGISKLVETYLKWKLPLKEYGLVPNHSFLQEISACQIGVLPEYFFDKVEEGSIVIKKSQSFSFCNEGLIIDGDAKPIKTDLVIFATGYKGDQKLRNIFKSPVFQNYISRSERSSVPLYRKIIHPRIPQLAIIGYAESISNIVSDEMRCQWLSHFLDENIELPSIKEMEKDVKLSEENMKQYAGKFYWRSCIVSCGIWYNDQLCKDMKCNPRRKKNHFAELFEPYGPTDYTGSEDQGEQACEAND
ncbi:probable flavin-containing monooxygenase 1 [Vicia villosa]|uniref:probable flavin-containing monooxygenase 1 n=1 Tax=Vicia villosa TaxID=3911 RepID=UPI00273CA436|nr:probable flavin-containing monooxygenase 1 [Vicia villosa]